MQHRVDLQTPGGKPASLIKGSNAKAAKGVFSLGLRIMQFPVANAGPILSPTLPIGPFQGMIPAVTPRGSLRTIFINPSSCGKASPASLSVQPALYRSVSAHNVISKAPKEPHGAPSVIRVSSPSCLECLSTRSANLFSRSLLLPGGVAFHDGKAYLNTKHQILISLRKEIGYEVAGIPSRLQRRPCPHLLRRPVERRLLLESHPWDS